MTSYVIACAGWTHCLVDDKGVSHRNDTFLWVNERYEKNLCLQRKNPTPHLIHVTLRECSLFILSGGGGRKFWGASLRGGGSLECQVS